MITVPSAVLLPPLEQTGADDAVLPEPVFPDPAVAVAVLLADNVPEADPDAVCEAEAVPLLADAVSETDAAPLEADAVPDEADALPDEADAVPERDAEPGDTDWVPEIDPVPDEADPITEADTVPVEADAVFGAGAIPLDTPNDSVPLEAPGAVEDPAGDDTGAVDDAASETPPVELSAGLEDVGTVTLGAEVGATGAVEAAVGIEEASVIGA